jgi:hypothetical protein
LYIFWKGNAATGYNIWYTKTDGYGYWPASCVSLGEGFGFNTGQAPSAIELNGRLWLAWVDETPIVTGRYYIWVASSPDGLYWTNASQVYIDTASISNQDFAISPYNVTLGVFDDTLWVFFNSATSENRTWYTTIKPIPGSYGRSIAKLLPNWGIGEPCCVTSSRTAQFVFSRGSNNDLWFTVRYPGKPDVWNLPINIYQTAAKAVSRSTPTAAIDPGYPGGAAPRVWLLGRGGGNDYLWEYTYPF